MDIVCENDTDEGTVVDLLMAEALVDLDPGEDITCTFFNFDAPVTIEDVNNGGTFLLGNQQNSISISGATPNKKVYLIWGFSKGLFNLGGNLCPGIQLGITPPKLLASLKADGEGNINTSIYIPFLGVNLAYLQTIDSGNCTVGSVESFPILSN